MPSTIILNPSVASLQRSEGLSLSLSDIYRRFSPLMHTKAFQLTTELVAVASIFAATFIWIMAL